MIKQKYKLVLRTDKTQTAVTYGDDNTVEFGGEWGSKSPDETKPIEKNEFGMIVKAEWLKNYIWIENVITQKEIDIDNNNIIKQKLIELDQQRIRPLAEISNLDIKDKDFALKKIQGIEKQAQELRDQLKE